MGIQNVKFLKQEQLLSTKNFSKKILWSNNLN